MKAFVIHSIAPNKHCDSLRRANMSPFLRQLDNYIRGHNGVTQSQVLTVVALPKINSTHEITAARGERVVRGRLAMRREAMKQGDGDTKKRWRWNKKELANYNGCSLGRLPTGSSQPREFKLSLYILAGLAVTSLVLGMAVPRREICSGVERREVCRLLQEYSSQS